MFDDILGESAFDMVLEYYNDTQSLAHTVEFALDLIKTTILQLSELCGLFSLHQRQLRHQHSKLQDNISSDDHWTSN